MKKYTIKLNNSKINESAISRIDKSYNNLHMELKR